MFYQFKLRVSYIIFLIFNLTTVAFSDVNKINEIDILGTQRIDTETVISYSNVGLGDIYTEELGNQILKDLFDTNLFSNIEVIFDENKLQINVKENPTINLVKFSGNSKIKDEDLLIEISLKERSVYSKSKVKKDTERMLSLYQRSGRLSTEIKPKVEFNDEIIDLTFLAKQYLLNIDGFRKYVREQAFLGIPAFFLRSAQDLIPRLNQNHIERFQKHTLRGPQ